MRRIKHWFLFVSFISTLWVGLFMAYLPVGQVAAAVNFSLSWKDATTITVSGSLSGTLTTTQGSTSTSFSGTISGGPNSCTSLGVTINSSNTKATIEPYTYNAPSAGSPPVEGLVNDCYGEYFGSQSEVSNIPIGGTRPTTESHAEQATYITLSAAGITTDSAPKSIKFTFHSGSASGAVADTVSASAVDAVSASGEAAVNYNAPEVYLTGGKYTVCFSALSGCQSFTKVTGQIYLGTFNANPAIDVEVQDNYGGYNDTAVTVGPVSVTLQQNGKTIQTIQTNTVTVQPNTAAGTAPTNTQVNLTGAFPNVGPGTYQVCPGGSSDGALSSSGCSTVTVKADGTVSPNPVVVQENTTPSGGGGGTTTPTCDSTGGPLSWIFCAGITEVTNAETALEGVVNKMLQTHPISFSNGDPTHVYEVWSNFRVYGNIILVIALLMVVFAEVIGGGLIDAYTAKKMLPRLLVAAILINLSIYIVAALEDIANIVGSGINAIISAPFQGVKDAAGQPVWRLSIDGWVGSGGLLGILGAGAAIWALGGEAIAAIALFVGLPLLIAVVGVIVTLMLRQGILVFLVLISPVAFALYVLPNTEQFFKKWWNLLFKTLLVYPIVAVVFAMANVTAVIVSGFGVGGALGELMGVAAICAPLFLIPFAFKLSGGAIAGISSAASNIGKKAYEGVRGSPNNPNSLGSKVRERLNLRRIEKGMTGPNLNKAINPVNFTTADRRARRRQDITSRRASERALAGAKYAESDTIVQANKNNDRFWVALANPKLADEKVAGLDNRIDSELDPSKKQGLQTERAGWTQAMSAARQVHNATAVKMTAAQGLAATGYQWSAGRKGYNELAKTMSNITGAELTYQIDPETGEHAKDRYGNEIITGATGREAGTYADAMDNAQFALKNAGRFEFGGINGGGGWDPKAGYGKASGYTAGQAKAQYYSTGAMEWMGVDPATLTGTTEENVQTMTESVQRGLADGSLKPEDVGAWHETLLDAYQSPIKANKDEIKKQLDAINRIGTRANSPPPGDPAETPILQTLEIMDKNNRDMRSRGPNIDDIENQNRPPSGGPV